MPISEQKALEVVEAFAKGGFLRDLFDELGVSSPDFYRARKQYSSVDCAYTAAREGKADHFADEVVRIADAEGDPNDKRVKIDARKWSCQVFNRQVYGDKIDMAISGRVDIGAALSEARNRALRIPCDSVVMEEAEVIDLTAYPLLAPPDAQSVKAEGTSENVDPFED